MKKFKHWLFYSLVLLVTFSLQSAQMRTPLEIVDLDEKTVKDMIYNAGSLYFYNEYHAKKLPKGGFSFMLKDCDPVPVHTFGDIRFFFSSAIQGGGDDFGGADAIGLDDSITDVIALRARSFESKGCGSRFEFYMGLNKNKFKKIKDKKIYVATFLAISRKDLEHTDYVSYDVFSPARRISSHDTTKEVTKRLKDQKDWDFKSPAFLKVFKELLGEGWSERDSFFHHPSKNFTRDDIYIGNGVLGSSKVYWTEKENKLKGIEYKNKKN